MFNTTSSSLQTTTVSPTNVTTIIASLELLSRLFSLHDLYYQHLSLAMIVGLHDISVTPSLDRTSRSMRPPNPFFHQYQTLYALEFHSYRILLQYAASTCHAPPYLPFSVVFSWRRTACPRQSVTVKHNISQTQHLRKPITEWNIAMPY